MAQAIGHQHLGQPRARPDRPGVAADGLGRNGQANGAHAQRQCRRRPAALAQPRQAHRAGRFGDDKEVVGHPGDGTQARARRARAGAHPVLHGGGDVLDARAAIDTDDFDVMHGRPRGYPDFSVPGMPHQVGGQLGRHQPRTAHVLVAPAHVGGQCNHVAPDLTHTARIAYWK